MSMNRRRLLLTSLTAGLQRPSHHRGHQAGKTTRVGVLYPGADNSIFRGNFDGFRQALGAAGYVEERNISFDVRIGDGRPFAPRAPSS